jgi:hypothetical protein
VEAVVELEATKYWFFIKLAFLEVKLCQPKAEAFLELGLLRLLKLSQDYLRYIETRAYVLRFIVAISFVLGIYQVVDNFVNAVASLGSLLAELSDLLLQGWIKAYFKPLDV